MQYLPKPQSSFYAEMEKMILEFIWNLYSIAKTVLKNKIGGKILGKDVCQI